MMPNSNSTAGAKADSEQKAEVTTSSPNNAKPYVMPSFSSSKNWTEDYKHENGNYLCNCCQCKEYFYGHKRRPLCKECSDKYDAS